MFRVELLNAINLQGGNSCHFFLGKLLFWGNYHCVCLFVGRNTHTFVPKISWLILDIVGFRLQSSVSVSRCKHVRFSGIWEAICLAKLAEEMGIEQRLESGRVKETRNYGAKDSFQYASKRPWLVLLYLSVDISESCWDLAYAFIIIYHTIAFTQFSVVKTGHLYESKLWYPSVAIQIYDQNINGRSRDGHLL
jgi:hypothetical protein